MSNIKGEQPLPLDMPEQPTERYTVRQIPGLALWVVWDTVADQPRSTPTVRRAVVESHCDNLNRA